MQHNADLGEAVAAPLEEIPEHLNMVLTPVDAADVPEGVRMMDLDPEAVAAMRYHQSRDVEQKQQLADFKQSLLGWDRATIKYQLNRANKELARLKIAHTVSNAVVNNSRMTGQMVVGTEKMDSELFYKYRLALNQRDALREYLSELNASVRRGKNNK